MASGKGLTKIVWSNSTDNLMVMSNISGMTRTNCSWCVNELVEVWLISYIAGGTNHTGDFRERNAVVVAVPLCFSVANPLTVANSLAMEMQLVLN